MSIIKFRPYFVLLGVFRYILPTYTELNRIHMNLSFYTEIYTPWDVLWLTFTRYGHACLHVM